MNDKASISEKKFERDKQKQFTIDQQFVSVKFRPLPDEYKNPFRLNDCEVCYNPLSCDLYNDCTFFCKYCFIRNRLMSIYSAYFDNWKPDKVRPADFSIVERKFDHAFRRNKPASGEVLALRKGIPIHFGVLTDNFQPIEKHYRLTLKFLKLLKEYDYPLIVSTKSDLILSPEYYRALTDLSHVIIQVSFTTTNQKTSLALDGSAPVPKRRLAILSTYAKADIRTVMRLAPIICPITDKETYQSIHDAKDHDAFGVLMKGFYIGANKTISNFFGDKFGVNIYEFYRKSGTLPYDGCNVCYHPQKQNLFTVKAINLCKKIGLQGVADTMLSPIISTQKHCCGGDGLDGFNPNNESDLSKCGNFSMNNTRYWIYRIFRDGKLSFDEFEKIPALNKLHKKLNDDYFYSGFELTWATFLGMNNEGYFLKKDDPFLRFIRLLQKHKICLKDGESMVTQKRWVSDV